jgi:predicted alpha/beta-fold hydrolase
MLAARTFGNSTTPPTHRPGFAGADDYHTRASSIRFLPKVTTPTLCLSAEDDPFLPAEAVSRARSTAAPAIEFRVSQHGGHIGFVAGAPGRPRYWAEESVVRWMERRL